MLAFLLAKWLIALLQRLPLAVVARLGRVGGALAFALDARHRRAAINNIASTIGQDWSAGKIRATARENFRRIGENFAAAVKTASMTNDQIKQVCCFSNLEPMLFTPADGSSDRFVVAIGHFGNFELYTSIAAQLPKLRGLSTYRGLPDPRLNRLLLELRCRSGCRFFERRTDARALKAAMNESGALLGLLADQHAGDNGLRLPFLGRDCSTTSAPALFALRYNARLFTAICRRTAVGRWEIAAGPEIPTFRDGRPRPVADIMLDVNRAFEQEVRRDPANWFWVHKRWKHAPKRSLSPPAESAPLGSPNPAIQEARDQTSTNSLGHAAGNPSGLPSAP